MGKMILLVCLIAGSDKGGWKIPQPNIISLDIVGLQAGPAFGGMHDFPYRSLGAYICQLRGYWGETFSLLVGLDGLRGHTSFWKEYVSLGSSDGEEEYCVPVHPMGYWIIEGYAIIEILSPHVGIALLAPAKSTRCCCIGGMFPKRGYSPRIEMFGSVSVINLGAYVEVFAFQPTFRFGLSFLLFRSSKLLVEHRWFAFHDAATPGNKHSFDFSLVFNLGGDILGMPLEYDSTTRHFPIPPPPESVRKYKAYLYESNIVQASGGVDVYSGEFLLPSLSISLMDLRLYPERNVPLFVGIEGARFYWGNTMNSTASNKILSLISPRVGLVILMKPRPSMRSSWIWVFEGERFVPRLEFSAGTSLINLGNLGGSNLEPFSNPFGLFAMIRTELRWKFSATMSMHAEHRWFMPSRFSANFEHSFGLSLSVALGKDNIRTNKKD